MSDRIWISEDQHTIPQLLEARLESDPDGEYLDVCGAKYTAAQVDEVACRMANGLAGLGVAETAAFIAAAAVLLYLGFVHSGRGRNS